MTRRGRRRTVGDGTAYDRARCNTPQNACADGAAGAISAGGCGSGEGGDADTRRADKRDDRLVHVLSSGIAGSPIRISMKSMKRESP